MSSESNDCTLFDYYGRAEDYVKQNHPDDIPWAKHLLTRSVSAETVLDEYIWCVLNSGFRYEAAKKIYEKLCETKDITVVRHPAKRRAIEGAMESYQSWFDKLVSLKTNEQKMQFIGTLPFMGPVIRWHFAKSLGLDVAKPDLHLVRIATRYGFQNVQNMCKFIQTNYKSEEPLSMIRIDIVLWRYAKAYPELVK